MRAVQITEFGGPEVVAVREVSEPQPGAGQLLIDVARCGVNFADTLQREDAYLSSPTLPLIPGTEVVGRTADGRRLAALIDSGGYAERAVVTGEASFEVPDNVDDVTAVALLVQGLTAWWLINPGTHVGEGDSVVVNAAAGGVGSLAVQLAKRAGARRVIATASSAEKRELALSLGADAAVDPATEDLTAALREANEDKPVDVVLEMTGGRVTDQSLAALAPFGRLIYFGMASGQPASAIPPDVLLRRSITVSGFWLALALRRLPLLRDAYAELAGLAGAGQLRVINGGDYPMSQVRQAHEDLRARRTTGKLVIDPSR